MAFAPHLAEDELHDRGVKELEHLHIQVTLIITTKLLLIQSDLVSYTYTYTYRVQNKII